MRYIGNVQLTKITDQNAEFHIFIGEKNMHGKGIGTQATKLILNYAFYNLNLKTIYLTVNKKNHNAIKAYKKCGFYITSKEDENITMSKEN